MSDFTVVAHAVAVADPDAPGHSIKPNSDGSINVVGGSGGGGVTTLTPTDHSGTIAVGGTAQIAIPANADRLGFLIANPSGAGEALQVKFGVGGGYFDLLPGAAYETGATCWLGAIYVNAATSAHAFTAYEGA